MSPVRCTWVPPHSSRLVPMSSTRTESPYFSPNSIMAPVALADSMSITRASVGVLARISAFTRRSISRISAAVTAWLWAKSKRVRSALTSEPFCCTWSPSTSRRALCMMCVTEWLRMVAARSCVSTSACTASPTFRLPDSSTPWWPNTSALILSVSSTAKRAPAVLITPWSPTWPPDSA